MATAQTLTHGEPAPTTNRLAPEPSHSYCLYTQSQASALPDPSVLTCSAALATESLKPQAKQHMVSLFTCLKACLRSAHLSDVLLQIQTLALAAHLGEHFKHPL